MKCDNCGQPATVEEAVRVGKTFVFKHLCEACAAASGIIATHTPMPVGLTQKLTIKAAVRLGGAETACRACGMTINQFRSTKRLGCGECYTAFEPILGPLIAREHEGASHHCGKIPVRLRGEGGQSGGSATQNVTDTVERLRQRTERLRSLRADLRQALAAEAYERAAEIQREIDRLLTAEDRGDG